MCVSAWWWVWKPHWEIEIYWGVNSNLKVIQLQWYFYDACGISGM